jgi:hypothetical protein
VRFAGPALIVAVVLAGCGAQEPPDHTAMFVQCLQQRGGEVITAGAQLDGYPDEDVQQGVGAALESVSYFTIDAPVRGERRRALVFVADLHGATPTSPMPEAAELLRRARRGTARVRALVLMPAAQDVEAPIGACEQLAAPGQAVP